MTENLEEQVKRLQAQLKCCQQENHMLVNSLTKSQLKVFELEQELKEWVDQCQRFGNFSTYTPLRIQRHQ